MVNLFFVYELGTWSQELNAEFTLKDCLFGAVKLTEITDADKYKYSGCGIRFDTQSLFLLPDDIIVKNVIIFGFDMSSSVYIGNKKIS